MNVIHSLNAKFNQNRKTGYAIGGVVVLLLAYSFWPSNKNDVAGFRTAEISRGNIRQVISATGNLAAVSTVDVGTQVSGQIIKINADFNSQVKADEVIAIIDPESFQARLNQAYADLSSAEANLSSARAQYEESQMVLVNAERDLKRQHDLLARKLISQSILDAVELSRDQARARVSISASAIRSAQANVAQRKAAVENAKLDIKRTQIRAPVDGVIISRSIELGQTVAASFQTPVLFSIAEDLSQMQIVLSIDEADIGQLTPGLSARFTVDAFPGRNYTGRVEQVRMSATNTQGVITYPVVVAVNNADLSLLPGMTANAEIQITERNDVVRVPLRALSFKPAQEVVNPFGGAQPAGNQQRPQRPEGANAQGGGQGGAMMQALSERLKLDQAQQDAVREAFAQGRQRMMATGQNGGAAGAGNGANRGQFMEQVFASIRSKLNPDQITELDLFLQERRTQRSVTVFVLEDGKPNPVQVRVGLSDSDHAELLSDELKVGDKVIIGMQATGG